MPIVRQGKAVPLFRLLFILANLLYFFGFLQKIGSMQLNPISNCYFQRMCTVLLHF